MWKTYVGKLFVVVCIFCTICRLKPFCFYPILQDAPGLNKGGATDDLSGIDPFRGDIKTRLSPSIKEDKLSSSLGSDSLKDESMSMPAKNVNKTLYVPLSVHMSAQQIIDASSGQGKLIGKHGLVVYRPKLVWKCSFFQEVMSK